MHIRTAFAGLLICVATMACASAYACGTTTTTTQSGNTCSFNFTQSQSVGLGDSLNMLLTEYDITTATSHGSTTTNGILFTFKELGLGTADSVTGIDFRNISGLFSSIYGYSESSGVDFTGGPNSYSSRSWNSGVNHTSEWVSFFGVLQSGVSLENVVAALESTISNAFKVALGVTTRTFAYYDYRGRAHYNYTTNTYVNQDVSSCDRPSPVPLPSAVWLFGSALVGFVTMSNRRRV